MGSTEKWKHNKTGNIYTVICLAIDCTNARDGNNVVVYAREGKVFVRDATEFVKKFTFMGC